MGKTIPVLEEKFSPTPIYRLAGDYSNNNIYIKRDDFIPFSFGGNKARKAAFFYKDIIKENPDVIMTYGSNSSNHCRIIANMAASLGKKCHIIAPDTEVGENKLLNRMMVEKFGASIEVVPVEMVHDTIENRIESFKKEGLKPYFIMGGGHGNLGTMAYIKAYIEINKQVNEGFPKFKYIFFASGTGTTQAGLVCGKELSKDTWKPEIVGISIARKNPRGRDVVKESIKEYFDSEVSKEFFDDNFKEEDLIFVDDYAGNGYGQLDMDVKETIDKVMTSDGIPMDFVYVGKAFCGMIKYLEKENIKGEDVLFIHTGGTPLFFDSINN